MVEVGDGVPGAWFPPGGAAPPIRFAVERSGMSTSWVITKLLPPSKLQWGSAGPPEYHGEPGVGAGPTSRTSPLTVRLHTERVEGAQINDGLDQTLRGIKSAVERAGQS